MFYSCSCKPYDQNSMNELNHKCFIEHLFIFWLLLIISFLFFFLIYFLFFISGNRLNRYDSQSRSRASSFSRHQNSNDGCSPSNTPGSSSSCSGSSITAHSAANVPTVSVVAGVNSTTSNSPLVTQNIPMSGNSTPARSRGSRSSRHTVDYDYLDMRRFRSCDEYSQGSGASHDEDAAPQSGHSTGVGGGLRSDSPLLSRLGPIVSGIGAHTAANVNERVNEMLEVTVNSGNGRRRCDKSPAKQKGNKINKNRFLAIYNYN